MAYERRKTKVELLSPAGDMECLNMALTYGADAIYLAGQEFGMRTASANFSNKQLAEAVLKAHEKNVPVFLTCNTLPRNDELDRLPAFLEAAQDAGVDAIIVADLGVMNLVKQYAPKVEIHISTQAGIVILLWQMLYTIWEPNVLYLPENYRWMILHRFGQKYLRI